PSGRNRGDGNIPAGGRSLGAQRPLLRVVAGTCARSGVHVRGKTVPELDLAASIWVLLGRREPLLPRSLRLRWSALRLPPSPGVPVSNASWSGPQRAGRLCCHADSVSRAAYK